MSGTAGSVPGSNGNETFFGKSSQGAHGRNLQAFYGLLGSRIESGRLGAGPVAGVRWRGGSYSNWGQDTALSVLLSMATNKQPPKVNAVKVFSVKAFVGQSICINSKTFAPTPN